jgi:hypothetical protein
VAVGGQRSISTGSSVTAGVESTHAVAHAARSEPEAIRTLVGITHRHGKRSYRMEMPTAGNVVNNTRTLASDSDRHHPPTQLRQRSPVGGWLESASTGGPHADLLDSHRG